MQRYNENFVFVVTSSCCIRWNSAGYQGRSPWLVSSRSLKVIISIGGDTLKTCFSFFKGRKQEGGEVGEAKSESLLDSGIIHFGFSTGAVQPVINVRGDELFAGKELIRKWSSRETAY